MNKPVVAGTKSVDTRSAESYAAEFNELHRNVVLIRMEMENIDAKLDGSLRRTSIISWLALAVLTAAFSVYFALLIYPDEIWLDILLPAAVLNIVRSAVYVILKRRFYSKANELMLPLRERLASLTERKRSCAEAVKLFRNEYPGTEEQKMLDILSREHATGFGGKSPEVLLREEEARRKYKYGR